MSDGPIVTEEARSITVQAATLAGIAVPAAVCVDGTRAWRPWRGVDVALAEGSAHASLELTARYGEELVER
jgi:hypothetical protein